MRQATDTLLTIQDFFREAGPFKVGISLAVQVKEQIVGQLPAPFIVPAVNSWKTYKRIKHGISTLRRKLLLLPEPFPKCNSVWSLMTETQLHG